MIPAGVPSPTLTIARDLLRRWDRQQSAFIRHRTLRFDTIVRLVAATGSATPRILDLCSGPGSLTAAIVEQIPGATVVAIDKDPVLLRIARDVFADQPRVRVTAADLDRPDWVHTVAHEPPFDAVVSSTALHWLQPEVLTRVYRECAQLLTDGGVLLNGDHLYYDPVSAPRMRSVAENDADEFLRASHADGAEEWDAWWDAAKQVPEYAAEAAAHERVWHDAEPPLKVTLGYHLEALRSVGFTEAGTVWQFLDDFVVYGVR